MNLRYAWTAAALSACAVTGMLLAQAPPPPAPDERPDFGIDVVNVQVPVSIRDRKGNFVNGLIPNDFELLDEGVRQKVQLDVTAHPISLVVAVQANATARQILPTVQKAGSMFGPLVAGETGEVAVIAFDHRVQHITPFTSNVDEIKKGFTSIKVGSTTHHLDDAAMEGVNMLRNRGKDRKKVLIIISETRDNGSAFSPRDVLTNAEFSNVEIYTVSMNHLLNQLTTKAEPNRPNPVPPEARGQLPMGVIQTGTTDAQTNMGNWTPIFKEIFTLVKGIFVPNSHEVYTKFTGGREQNFVTLSGLEEAIHNIGEEVHSQYLLTFTPPGDAKAGYHEITVRVLSAANLEIRTRPGYWIAPRQADTDKKK
ncbi:MAG: hypothetical protein RL328_1227 [Acidobacteriota bacterium]|jgi:VWFA-related protein